MNTKLYPSEKVFEVLRTLAEAPVQPLKFIPHSETVSKLSKHIKDMHFLKNYDARQITKMINDQGIKITLKEVKIILQTKEKSTKKT